MMDYLRKNNKKILAIVGVFLMIAFVADYRGLARRQGYSRSETVIGKVGSEEIRTSEYDDAEAEWQALTQGMKLVLKGPQVRVIPINLAEDILRGHLLRELGPQYAQFAGQIVQQPARRTVGSIDATTYMLLLHEARRTNAQVSPDQVQEFLKNLESQIEGISSMATVSNSVEPELRDRAIEHWMMVVEAFARISSAVKATPAEALREMVAREEKISVALVEFAGAPLKSEIKAPTTQQAREFFEKYKDKAPDTTDTGFGYRYPNRVQIQYIRVLNRAVMETISLEDAYKYYKDHKSEFMTVPTTQPTSQAATAPTTQPLAADVEASTRPATRAIAAATQASTQPTTKPFEEVVDQIKKTLADKRTEDIAKSAWTTMNTDWLAFKQTAKGATTTPMDFNTSLKVPYASLPYLYRLRDKIQEADPSKILVETYQGPGLMSANELAEIKDPGAPAGKETGIGASRSVDMGIGFPEYAIGAADAFLSEAQRRAAEARNLSVQALYQPSPRFRDGAGNFYVFRIIQADPAHAPASLAEVESKLVEDFKTAEAFAKAKESAAKFMELLKTMDGLQQAVNASGGSRPLFTTEPYGEGDSSLKFKPEKDAPKWSSESISKFTRETYALLDDKLRSGRPHPAMMVELPRSASVAVAQLEEAKPATEGPDFENNLSQTRVFSQVIRRLQLVEQWMRPQAVAQRVGWVADPINKPRTSGPPPEDDGPFAPF